MIRVAGHPTTAVEASISAMGALMAILVNRKGSSRWVGRLALVAFGLVLGDVLASLLFLRDAEWIRGQAFPPYDPPLFNSAQRSSLARLERLAKLDEEAARGVGFDAELGWGPETKKREYDWAGSRGDGSDLLVDRDSRTQRIVAVGCSFTRGAEVLGTETWATRIEQLRSSCEVGNLGIGGYSLEQVLLRLRRDGFVLEPEEVWLGFVPATLLRMASLYAPCRNRTGRMVAFKPCFRLDTEGKLVLHPNPVGSLRETLALLGDQERFFEALIAADYWVQRCPSAYRARGSALEHYSSTLRVLSQHRDLSGRDPFGRFRSSGDEFRRLAREIVLTMRRECTDRGILFRLFVLSSSRCLLDSAVRGERSWQSLVDELRGEGVWVHDVSDSLELAGGHEEAGLWAPGGHYTPKAHEIVAQDMMKALGR